MPSRLFWGPLPSWTSLPLTAGHRALLLLPAGHLPGVCKHQQHPVCQVGHESSLLCSVLECRAVQLR